MAENEIQELAAYVDDFGTVAYQINGRKSNREDYTAITLSRIADALEELADLAKALAGAPARPGAPAAGPGTGMFGG